MQEHAKPIRESHEVRSFSKAATNFFQGSPEVRSLCAGNVIKKLLIFLCSVFQDILLTNRSYKVCYKVISACFFVIICITKLMHQSCVRSFGESYVESYPLVRMLKKLCLKFIRVMLQNYHIKSWLKKLYFLHIVCWTSSEYNFFKKTFKKFDDKVISIIFATRRFLLYGPESVIFYFFKSH